MERLKTSYVSISNYNIKYPIEKSILIVNLESKRFPTAVDNADIWSLKSLHTFFEKCLYHILMKFEQNCMVQTARNFELFDKKQNRTKQNKTNKQNKNKNKKPGFLNHFWQSVDAILEDVFMAETIF